MMDFKNSFESEKESNHFPQFNSRYIDAQDTSIPRNWGGLLNSHINPVKFNTQAIFHRTKEERPFRWTVFIVAKRPLERGEELVLGYGEQYKLEGQLDNHQAMEILRKRKKRTKWENRWMRMYKNS